MRTLNLGILAHVDAGKTSLTERLLYAAGIIDRIGSVDAGNTQTDTMALERQRGITIKAAVVSFVVGDTIINLIDTPGHPDFIAEVERVLNVLDGAVLVVSAVEGVEAQTRVLMRALERLHLPTLIFINKLDRRGAAPDRVFAVMAEKLSPALVPMGRADQPGTPAADVTPLATDDAGFRSMLVERLSDNDDAILAAYLDDPAGPPAAVLERALAAQSRAALVHPVYFGSAITGAGIEPLLAGITSLLPAAERDPAGPAAGTVFKVERGPAGERIAYARISAGEVHARDRLAIRGAEARVTAIGVFEQGACPPRAAIAAGRIGRLWGLSDIQIGDSFGPLASAAPAQHFAPPTLETVILPRHPADRGALWPALAQLAEQDPLIDLRKDDSRQDIFVSLYGEVQKQVIAATLNTEYGIEVEFRDTSVICIERPAGTGAAVEFLHKAPNPFLGTVGLRIAPAAIRSGIAFTLEVNSGAMPAAFYRAVEESVRATLAQGLCGWQVTDCAVTMTHSGYLSPMSTAADFRNLTPLVLVDALRAAGTLVCEPIQHFDLDLPADALPALLALLGRLGAIPEAPVPHGGSYGLGGTIPAARLHELQQALPGLTRGEGVLDCVLDGYRPVTGPLPVRARTDLNPLDRTEYLLRLDGRTLTQEGQAR